MTAPIPLLPQSRDMFFDEEQAQNDPVGHLRKVVNDLGDMYADIAAAHNTSPQRVAQGPQPTPATGQLLVWLNMTNNTRYLLYNDNGVIVKTPMSTK